MLSKIFITVLVAAILTGCITDKCGSVLCRNEGVCVEGTCACAYGFEGELCENKWYDKFNYTWTAVEIVKTDTIRKYPLNILPGNSPDTFYILGMAQSIDTVLCTRKSYRVFTMHERLLPDSTKMQGGEGEFIPGTGNVTGMYSFNKQDVITPVGFSWSH